MFRLFTVMLSILMFSLPLPVFAQISLDDYKPVEGPAKKERTMLLEKIRKAKSKNIGVSGYLKFFKSIEDRAKTGASEESISKEVERIEQGLNKQVGFLEMPDFSGSKIDLTSYPITNYVSKVEKLVNKNFKPIGKVSNNCCIKGTISKSGKLKLSKSESKKSLDHQGRKLLISEILKVKVFPVPPKGPIRIRFDIDSKGTMIKAIYDEKVDFDVFRADMQRRIKRAWYPPKTNKLVKASVLFKIAINGQVKGIEIEKSSGIGAFDASLVKAVKNASLMRSLPDGSPVITEISFAFDYNPQSN